MRRIPLRALVVVSLLAAATVADAARSRELSGIVSRIKRVQVESTALAAVGYSKRLRALEIEFRNGAIYRYLEVEPSVYEALLNARSKARFYDDNIRRRYRSFHVRPRQE